MNNPNKVGLVFGLLLGGLHLLWSLLVFLGLAQSLYDFILWSHMVHLQVAIGPFDPIASVTLIIVTAVVGYLLGFVAAWIWNHMHQS